MTATTENPDEVWADLLEHHNRADPYPLFARLRAEPVRRLSDGAFVITGYDEILQLTGDPRISSEPGKAQALDDDSGHDHDGTGDPGLTSAFVMLDPPEHDRLRRQTMRHFGPPHAAGYVDGLRAEIHRVANDLIDGFADRDEIDLVADFAYPLPVWMICDVLGVPAEDEPLFHTWSEAIIAPAEATTPEEAQEKQREGAAATGQMARYLGALAESRRGNGQGDLLSGLVNDHGPDGVMSSVEVLNTSIMLLIGGHETTVNMIANGVLTLLRHPDVLARVLHDPDVMPRVFEELLRLEPPAQVTPKYVALADVQVGDVTIPAGSPVWMVWAAANRDPRHFSDPDRLDPDREAIDHLGFGAGLHSCFGAPLARLETQIALGELFRRLVNPRLVTDPPPYRRNPFLRGPASLRLTFDGVLPAG
jgi:cytochrome P450